MTIAFTILMMRWDWPNARQRSGTDEKTWLSDFLCSGSSASACAPSCRVLYHYWQSWSIQQQVFISRFIFRHLFISTAVPPVETKNVKKRDLLHQLCTLQDSHFEFCEFLWWCRAIVRLSAGSHVWVMLREGVCVCVWPLLYLEQ